MKTNVPYCLHLISKHFLDFRLRQMQFYTCVLKIYSWIQPFRLNYVASQHNKDINFNTSLNSLKYINFPVIRWSQYTINESKEYFTPFQQNHPLLQFWSIKHLHYSFLSMYVICWHFHIESMCHCGEKDMTTSRFVFLLFL